MKPIIKWAGGKRQLLPTIKNYMPENYGVYCEAFLGGGALLFDLLPNNAIVNDKNKDLINMYKIVKNHCTELIIALEKHQNHNCETYYYKVRDIDRDIKKYNQLTPIQKAARLIYLNKTCYNGLYRVNKSGQFNVPFGMNPNPIICDEKSLRDVSKYLRDNHVVFYNMDFGEFLKNSKKGDFVYLDPPYYSKDERKYFLNYQADGFGGRDQIRLKETCDVLTKNGVLFVLSNANVKYIRELYSDYAQISVEVKRSISCMTDQRESAKELLIRNW